MISTHDIRSSFNMIFKTSTLTTTLGYLNLNIIRIIIILFCTLILPFIISFNALFADDFYGTSDTRTEVLNLSDNTTLDVEMSDEWSVSKDVDNNVLINYVNTQNPLVITVLNNVYPYKSLNGLNQYITLHQEQAVKLIPNNGNIQRGYDQILNVKVPFIMILEEKDGKKTVHKVLYPYNNDKVFVIVTSITGASPMKETEELLSNIILAILKEATNP